MKVINVVGARPNMMKIAPIITAMQKYNNIEPILLHTGQHYDQKMSQIFFDELGIPKPDIYLGIGSGSHAEQTANIMIAFEKILIELKPDVVLVVGDVNSTMACAITATKLHIPVVHVEAGLRSFDRTMPEEINRLVTDAIADMLFTTSRNADKLLQKEGIPSDKIFFVGNVMIDTLNQHRDKAKHLKTSEKFGLKANEYALLTLHRPSNVDNKQIFDGILDALVTIQQDIPILFPAHPRTQKRIEEFGFSKRLTDAPNIRIIDPQGYLAFLDLMMHARMMLTDSGGIQEETTILNVPCLTLRENTERPITITEGTSQLVGADPEKIISAAKTILADSSTSNSIPELWDGHAADRIVTALIQNF